MSVDIWSTRAVPAGKSHDVAYASCVRRAAIQRRPLALPVVQVEGGPSLWFVKVTVGGGFLDQDDVRDALERLSVERAFLVSVRFDGQRADVRYWDECDNVDVAIRQAMSLWGDDEVFARLPGWKVKGLEVVDQQTARKQWDRGDHPPVFVLGEILPFD